MPFGRPELYGGQTGNDQPADPKATRRAALNTFTSDLMFTLAQSLGAGPQKGAGLAAALTGPMARRSMVQQAEDQRRKMEMDLETAKSQNAERDAKIQQIKDEAAANGVRWVTRVNPDGSKEEAPIRWTPIGGIEQLGEGIPTELAPTKNIDPLSDEGIDAEVEKQTRLAPLKADTGTWTAENVMVDGKQARVLRLGLDYVDPNTKQPIMGRITPYVPPPTPRARGEITPTAESGLITSLNNQWQKAAKDIQELYRARAIMQSGLEAARGGDMNAGAQAVLVTFQKFLDPTSVVRESEYARSAQGLAMAARIRGWFEKNFATGGAGVPLAELETFAKLANDINSKLANETNSLMAAEKRRIGAVAARYNIPAEVIFSGFNFSPEGSGGPKPGTEEGGYVFQGGDPGDPKNWKAK